MAASAPAPALAPTPKVSRARVATSMEPSGIVGTSWNSVRWVRPATSGYRTGRLASAFEMGGSTCSSSGASSCASSTRAQSPFSAYHRAASSASRPLNDGTVIRANSRYGTALLNSSAGSSSGASTIGRTAQSVGSAALSPRETRKQKQTIAYRPLGISQPRATLIDVRQNLRPVKRQSVSDSYKSPVLSPRASFVSAATPLALFTSSGNTSARFPSSTAAASAKCALTSPPPMQRSSSQVTSPVTQMTPRPIPKSERPWRQKLADAQRMRDAQADRQTLGGRHFRGKDTYESPTTARLLAVKASRRANIEHQREEKEQQLEKQIAALKCYVSEPGALDKNATVARFRQRMDEAASALPSATTATTPAPCASSLLSRMPSLSRRSTTAVTREALPEREQAKKGRPLSMVEPPCTEQQQRRLSVVKENGEQRPAAEEKQPSTANGKAPSPATSGKGTPTRGPKVMGKESPRLAQRKTATPTNGEQKQKRAEQKNGDQNKPAVGRRKLSAEKRAPEGEQQREEGKYNAVVQFRPQSLLNRKLSDAGEEKTSPPVEEERKPVPGTWIRSPKERFISQNKHLSRRSASESVAHLHRVIPLARVSSARMLAPGRASNKCESAFINRLAQSHNAAISVKAKGQSPSAQVLKMIKQIVPRPKQPQQRACATAVLDKSFANKRRFRLGVQKTLLLKGVPQKLCAQLRCRQAQLVNALVRLNIVWKEQKKTATVTILLADVPNVTWTRVESTGIRERKTKKTIPSKRQVALQQHASFEKENGPRASATKAHKQLQSTKAPARQPSAVATGPPAFQSAVAAQQSATVPTQARQPSSGQLVLPDQSLLEQYVHHKREALERLHRQAAEGGTPGAVGGGQQTHIGVPGASMLATMPHSGGATELPQPLGDSFHTANLGQQPKLRRQAPLSTQAFEKPKSLFEEQMQRQAIQLRQRAVRQSLHEPALPPQELQQVLARRRSSAAADNDASVAQSFVAAAHAQRQQQQPEQRYAAHIPLSGRQSTASVDSGHSGALDAATRQLDQMIDQARYKHSQHRNKFKEAIDYLDHIFEDFQHEAELCDTKKGLGEQAKPQKGRQQQPQTAKDDAQQPGAIEPVQATFRPGNVRSAKEAFEKVAAAIASEKSAKQRRQPPAAQPKPAKVSLREQATAFPTIASDVEVAETIVLPTRNTADRLDFTKHWLDSGQVSAWAQGVPKRNDAILGVKVAEEECYDSSDEHSLGSCSAEVAAINAADERRKRQKQPKAVPGPQKKATNNGTTIFAAKPNGSGGAGQLLRHKQQPPTGPPQIASVAPATAQAAASSIRPQPFRPQPQLGVLPPALGPQMHKVPSIEHLRAMRASSQDYQQQSMGSSVHSQEEGFRAPAIGHHCISTHSLQRIGVGGTAGAFHSYTPTAAQQQLKGSIQSLPDSALAAAQAILAGGRTGASQAARDLVSVPYPPPFPHQPSRQFATLARMDAQQQQNLLQPPQRVPPVPAHQSASAGTVSASNEHALAIDALVAELELNTDPSLCSAEKRRSFPTMQTETALNKQKAVAGQGGQQPHKNHNWWEQSNPDKWPSFGNSSARDPNRELANFLLKGAAQPQRRQTVGAGSRPFETINQEKLNPSKVDAMARIFGHQQTAKPAGATPSGNYANGAGTSAGGQAWMRRANTIGRVPSGERQEEPKAGKLNSAQQLATVSIPTIAIAQQRPNGHKQSQGASVQFQSPRVYRGPVMPRSVRTEGPVAVVMLEQRRDTPTVSEEPEGDDTNGNALYDNVQSARARGAYRDDSISLRSQCSVTLPPSSHKGAGGRIGQLIRKLGGNGKPPSSAASMVSLNRVSGNEPAAAQPAGGRGPGLTKANSLSGEPWKCQVIGDKRPSAEEEEKQQNGGLGSRVKTIFGGVVRRRVPT